MLYTQTSLRAQPEEFLDPNKWSSDGTVALCDYAFTKDGEYMAYSTGRCVHCFVQLPGQWLNRHLIASADSQSWIWHGFAVHPFTHSLGAMWFLSCSWLSKWGLCNAVGAQTGGRSRSCA